MKKILFILLFFPASAFAFSDQQLQTVMTVEQNDCVISNQIKALAIATQLAQDNGLGFNSSISTHTVSMSSQQIADILAAYQAFKAQQSSNFQGLP